MASKLKRIFIPGPVEVKVGYDGNTGDPRYRTVYFSQLIEDNFITDSNKIGKKATDIKRALDVLAEIEDAEKRAKDHFKACDVWPSDVYVDLTIEMWEKFNGIAEEPSNGWNALFYKYVQPQLKAITDAKDAPEAPPPEKEANGKTAEATA